MVCSRSQKPEPKKTSRNDLPKSLSYTYAGTDMHTCTYTNTYTYPSIAYNICRCIHGDTSFEKKPARPSFPEECYRLLQPRSLGFRV